MAAKGTFRDRHETAAHAKRLWQCRVYLRGSEWLKNKTTCADLQRSEEKAGHDVRRMRAWYHIFGAWFDKGITAEEIRPNMNLETGA